jgi:hypothetical protein
MDFLLRTKSRADYDLRGKSSIGTYRGGNKEGIKIGDVRCILPGLLTKQSISSLKKAKNSDSAIFL